MTVHNTSIEYIITSPENKKSQNNKLRVFFYVMAPFLVLLRIVLIPLVLLFFYTTNRGRSKIPIKILLKVLGIVIHSNLSDDEIKTYTDGCVVASNHISLFDFLGALSFPNCVVLAKTVPGLPGMLARFIVEDFSGSELWIPVNQRALVKRLKLWRENPQGLSLYTTPEMTINNGNGLFKFNPSFLCYGLPVVPLAFRATSFTGLTMHVAGYPIWRNIIRLLTVPYFTVNIDFLEKVSRADIQSKEAFAIEIQQRIARHLGIPATDWTMNDKHEYLNNLNSINERK